MSDPQQYPKRPKFFAHRVVRMLLKTCMAQETSPVAAFLVTVVAHTEDAKHYTAAPTFHNDQLIPILGIRKWETLKRARQEAIDAGWLHYELPAVGARKPGRYWSLIPDRFAQLDDLPSDEHSDRIQERDIEHAQKAGNENSSQYPKNGDGRGDGMGYGRGDGRGYGMGELPTRTRTLSLREREGTGKHIHFSGTLSPPYHTQAVNDALNLWFDWLASINKLPIDVEQHAVSLIGFCATPEELIESCRYGATNQCRNFKNFSAEQRFDRDARSSRGGQKQPEAMDPETVAEFKRRGWLKDEDLEESK